MVEMDREQKKKWHKVGVIAAEFVMVASVVGIVVITTLVAMGWNVNREGEIEQSGLLQLHTMPTGATVEIDGETMFARTNMSRSLSPGWHHLKTSRKGYDTWEKDIQMTSGWLMRIYYPRLFLSERKTETVKELGAGLEFYSVASDRKHLLWAEVDSTLWQWVDISSDKISIKEVDVAEILRRDEQIFTGEIISVEWNDDGDKVLAQVRDNDVTNWYLINLREVKESRNLTADFGLDFSTIKTMDGVADKLWALENGNLRLINAASQESSRILVDGVKNFNYVEGAVAYVRQVDGVNWVGVYREGEQGVTDLYKVTEESVDVWLSRYYNEDYLTLARGQKITVYKGTLPSYMAETKVKAKDFLEVFAEKELEFIPEQLEGGVSNEYVVAREGERVEVVDLDRGDFYNYNLGIDKVNWLDDSMLYGVIDKTLAVWDFDGTNRRELVKNVADYAVMVSDNNKYLYYLRNNDAGLVLEREQIMN